MDSRQNISFNLIHHSLNIYTLSELQHLDSVALECTFFLLASRGIADSSADGTRHTSYGVTDARCRLPNCVAETASRVVEGAANTLCRAVNGTSHATQQSSLAVGLLASRQNIVYAANKTAEESATLVALTRHIVWT
jgi:hypothetical protein